MNSILALLLAVSVLNDLDDEATAKTAAQPRADIAAESAFATNAPSAKASGANKRGKTVMITADRADYDRRDGVIFFEGHVYAEDPEFNMHSERLHVFVDGLNQLKRIVITGNVALTNEMKSGSCDRATYVKDLHRIIMYGTPGKPARLVDDSKNRSVVEGSKITFWTDSEQVEVDAPTILLDGGLPAGAIPSNMK